MFAPSTFAVICRNVSRSRVKLQIAAHLRVPNLQTVLRVAQRRARSRGRAGWTSRARSNATLTWPSKDADPVGSIGRLEYSHRFPHGRIGFHREGPVRRPRIVERCRSDRRRTLSSPRARGEVRCAIFRARTSRSCWSGWDRILPPSPAGCRSIRRRDKKASALHRSSARADARPSSAAGCAAVVLHQPVDDFIRADLQVQQFFRPELIGPGGWSWKIGGTVGVDHKIRLRPLDRARTPDRPWSPAPK